MATEHLTAYRIAAATAMLIVQSAIAQTSGSAGQDQNAPKHFDSQADKPQQNQSLSQRLERSNGVIQPPQNVDPQMHQAPPPSGDKMPVVPPPGSPGGDQSVKPKF